MIGAGMGGLAAAIDLAAAGLDVTVLERASAPGGKMREVMVGDAAIDAGPTVFTMRWVFEALFADAGAVLENRLGLSPAKVLARHAWRSGGTLDVFANREQSTEAIGAFAGVADARAYDAFCRRAADIHQTLAGPFMADQRPSPLELVTRIGWSRLSALWRTAPFQTLWSALGHHFQDGRLRQLFARYSTYVGSSPFAAPATLMLIAHVEQEGVWLVQDGMRRLADALRTLAEEKGARFHFNAEVADIQLEAGRVRGVQLASGDTYEAEAIVFNGDPQALASGLLGAGATRGAPPIARKDRSQSAVTWCLNTRASGFPLSHHTVFFSDDYRAEFDAVFAERRTPRAPTVYLCAQDRSAEDTTETPTGAERLLMLINAPADGDVAPLSDTQRNAALETALATLDDCGLTLSFENQDAVITTPAEFHALFPATGGALYGRANHGPFASFARPGAKTPITGLYLCGGGAHPGAGVPMATLSGRLAAAQLLRTQA